MTPEERYLMIREVSDAWRNKNTLRHHILLHIKEAMEEQREMDAKVADSVNAFWVGNLIRQKGSKPTP